MLLEVEVRLGAGEYHFPRSGAEIPDSAGIAVDDVEELELLEHLLEMVEFAQFAEGDADGLLVLDDLCE